MVQQLLKYWFIILAILISSCGSIHMEDKTRYQRKNLKRFTEKNRYFNRALGMHKRKHIRVQRSGTYNHPALTRGARQRLKSEIWLKKIGEGEIDFLR